MQNKNEMNVVDYVLDVESVYEEIGYLLYEVGVPAEKIEVWFYDDNSKIFSELIKGRIPFCVLSEETLDSFVMDMVKLIPMEYEEDYTFDEYTEDKHVFVVR